jgi:hypothetical protein
MSEIFRIHDPRDRKLKTLETKIKIQDGDGRHIENRQKAVSQAPTNAF